MSTSLVVFGSHAITPNAGEMGYDYQFLSFDNQDHSLRLINVEKHWVSLPLRDIYFSVL